MGKAKKKERKNKKSKQKICTFKHFFIPLHSLLRDKANGDPLAQLVEHNTFNVGVLGSSPKRITKESESYTKVTLFFYALNAPVYMVQLNRELNQEWIFRISFPKYSWRISLSLQLPLESSKHLCPHTLTANITS